MGANYETCRQCGAYLTDMREDAQFCSKKCTAAWTRNEGYHRERFHAEKEEQKTDSCQYCGTTFFFNSYADRGGQRQPRFCSNKCRQADYRKRHKESAFAGGANHWQDGRSDKTDRKGTSHAGSEKTDKGTSQNSTKRDKGTSQKEAPKDTSRNQQNKDTSQDARWKSKDAYVVLGVTYLSTQAQIKKAWMKIVREWHPDICKHPDATRITQAANAAWDKLKK